MRNLLYQSIPLSKNDPYRLYCSRQQPGPALPLKFDVTGIDGRQVTNAKLCLYNVDGANEGGDPSASLRAGFYHVSNDSWQEDLP